MWGSGILEEDSMSGKALGLGGGTLFAGAGAAILSTVGAFFSWTLFVFYFLKGGAGGYSFDL